MKRDHQINGLGCLSTVVALCRRELAPSHANHCPVEFEAEILRLQTVLRQRERECAEHLATITRLRKTRSELEQKLTSAPLPAIYHTVLPEIPIDARGKDAGEWHLAARTLQTHVNTYKRAIESKSEELVRMTAAFHGLKTLLSPPDKENAQVAAALASDSSTEAP
jgi:hypothetical protein